MAEILQFKNENTSLEELNSKIEKEITEVEAIANRFKMGYKPKTVEEAEEIWNKILAPGNSMKKRAEMLGDTEYKTTLERLEDMLDGLSEKEVNSGLIKVK